MKTENILEIMKTMNTNNIQEFIYEKEGVKIKLNAKECANSIGVAHETQEASELVVSEENPLTANSTAEANVKNVKLETVKTPLVGVFYESPSPDQPPFVKPGDQVKQGDVLCIIEAMKVMNEIVAPRDCTIKEVLVQNEEVVEGEQDIFSII